MYAGRIVEEAPVRALFKMPAHPYTQALLRAMPGSTHSARRLEPIEGQVPSLQRMPPGCAFGPAVAPRRLRRRTAADVSRVRHPRARCVLVKEARRLASGPVAELPIE